MQTFEDIVHAKFVTVNDFHTQNIIFLSTNALNAQQLLLKRQELFIDIIKVKQSEYIAFISE